MEKTLPNCILESMSSKQVITSQIRDLRITMALQEHQFNSQ